jgi:hypothetical protein
MAGTSPDEPHSTYLTPGTTDSLNFLRSTPSAAHRHHPENQHSNWRMTMPVHVSQGRNGHVQPATTASGITHSDQQQLRHSSKLAHYRCAVDGCGGGAV